MSKAMSNDEYIDFALRGLEWIPAERIDFESMSLDRIQELSSEAGPVPLLCATKREWKEQGRQLYSKTWGDRSWSAGRAQGKRRKQTVYAFSQTFAPGDTWETRAKLTQKTIVDLFWANKVSLNIDGKHVHGNDIGTWMKIKPGTGATSAYGVLISTHFEKHQESFAMTNHILLHELGHFLLGHIALLQKEVNRSVFMEKETEAELFAYVLGARLGFPMTQATNHYLASFCRGRYADETMDKALSNIRPMLVSLLDQLDELESGTTVDVLQKKTAERRYGPSVSKHTISQAEYSQIVGAGS